MSDDQKAALTPDIIASLVEDTAMELASDSPLHRASMHAFDGAREMMRDLVHNYTPTQAITRNVTGLSPTAVMHRAGRLVDNFCKGEDFELGADQRLKLASAIAQFVSLTFYASVLRSKTFTDDWLLEDESHALAPRYPEAQPDHEDEPDDEAPTAEEWR